jgi:hypothetical protein
MPGAPGAINLGILNRHVGWGIVRFNKYLAFVYLNLLNLILILISFDIETLGSAFRTMQVFHGFLHYF